MVVREPAKGATQWLRCNRLTYTPNPAFAGVDSFAWKVNDGASDSNVAAVTIRVQPDVQGPTVARVDSAGPNNQIVVVFDERVAKEDAEKPTNYAVDNGVQVQAAALYKDGQSVALTTSELKEGVAYSLSIGGIRDCAAKPNMVKPNTQLAFKHVLVGNGLFAEYFDGKDFNGKKIGERIDPCINFNWRKKPPLPSMKPGQAYSVRWTGRLKADHTEEYLIDFFKAWEHNRNPVRIWIDGKLLHNESPGGALVESTAFGTVALQAGKVYDLKVELSILRPELSQYADIYILRWSGLSTPKQPIAQANLGAVRQPQSTPPAAGKRGDWGQVLTFDICSIARVQRSRRDARHLSRSRRLAK